MFKAVASRTFKIQENYRETEHSIWRMELSFAAQLDQCKDYLPPARLRCLICFLMVCG